MPHYPDEIEYSDKYTDDYYEYRHVILPKDTYKKIPRNRLLTESVLFMICRSGELWEFSNQGGGCTMSCIDLSRIFCCSADPRAVILRPASLQLVLSLRLIRSAFDRTLILIRSAYSLTDINSRILTIRSFKIRN